MNVRGQATLWVRDADGNEKFAPNLPMVEQQELVTIISVQLDGGGVLNLAFHRGEFAGMLAAPNNTEAIAEVVVNLNMEEDAYERDSSDT